MIQLIFSHPHYKAVDISTTQGGEEPYTIYINQCCVDKICNLVYVVDIVVVDGNFLFLICMPMINHDGSPN